MTEPVAAKRPRTPAAIALAIMLLACGLIVTALLLLARGAVAYELPSADAATAPVHGTIRHRMEQSDDGSSPSQPGAEGENVPARAGRTAITGSFTLGAEPTPAERALEARIAESSVGGGFVADGRIHVVVEGGPSAAAPTQR